MREIKNIIFVPFTKFKPPYLNSYVQCHDVYSQRQLQTGPEVRETIISYLTRHQLKFAFYQP